MALNQDADEEEIDLTKLCYMPYARRSTEDKNKQVRSLGDQIKECRKFTKDNDLHIIGEPLKEKKSARRADGDKYEGVTKFLLEKGYERITKDKKLQRVIKPTKNAIAKMFKDPFYYGVLVQANQTIDLTTVYDFEPMIDKEIYDQVQLLGYGRAKDKKDKKRATFYPLHGFVYCAVCDSSKYMMVGKIKSRDGTHKLTYRCDNPNCSCKVKSFRAKFVFNSIADMLSKIELTDEAYDRYSKQIDSMTGTKIVALKEEIQSLNGVLNHIKKELKDRGLAIVNYQPSSPIYKNNEARISELTIEQAELETKINELNSKIVDPSQIKVSKEEFLNTFKLAPAKIRAGSAVEKDAMCRILFLNLRVDNEKVTSYLWREPFRSLVTAIENSAGARERT